MQASCSRRSGNTKKEEIVQRRASYNVRNETNSFVRMRKPYSLRKIILGGSDSCFWKAKAREEQKNTSTTHTRLRNNFVYSQVNNGVLYVLAYVEDNLHQGPLAPRSSFQHLTLIGVM